MTVTAVHFGTTSVPFTVVNSTTITTTAPAGLTGVQPVRVTKTPGGQSTTFADFDFGGLAPAITSLVPNNGAIAGGETVTINGTNLAGATNVTFGGTAATITANTATQITVTTPARAAGAAAVIVTTATGGASTGVNFTYNAPAVPTVTGINPINGEELTAINVTISGTLFSTPATVNFGAGNPATNVVVVNATTITCTSPALAAGAVTVSVTTGGQTVSGPTFTFVVAGAVDATEAVAIVAGQAAGSQLAGGPYAEGQLWFNNSFSQFNVYLNRPGWGMQMWILV